jgi:hypothetical protein
MAGINIPSKPRVWLNQFTRKNSQSRFLNGDIRACREGTVSVESERTERRVITYTFDYQ